MLKKTVLAAFAAAFVALPAVAAQCPLDMKKIDEALAASPQLSEEQMNEVKALRTQGEEQHKSGDHAGSVETLAKAKAMLGIE